MKNSKSKILVIKEIAESSKLREEYIGVRFVGDANKQKQKKLLDGN